MNGSNAYRDPAEKSLVNALLGFFGVVAAFLLLPRTLKLVFRKFAVGIIGEVVAIVTLGLLTEKLVDRVSDDH